MSKGKLFLIPAPLGGDDPDKVFPPYNKKIIEEINHYIVENEKSARKFIKMIAPGKKQPELVIFQLNKHDKSQGIEEFIKPLLEGKDMGLISEAGLPAIADPGSLIVNLAHKNHIKIIPLVGPSSIMMALMASGLNGQEFSFHGYLPKDTGDLKRKIKSLEKESQKTGKSQIFIETPYRNPKLFESLLKNLNPDTMLSIAVDLSLPTEEIHSFPVKEWKNKKINLHKRPAVFIFQAY